MILGKLHKINLLYISTSRWSFMLEESNYFFTVVIILKHIICQIKRDKTFHLRNSKKLLMVFGNLVIF